MANAFRPRTLVLFLGDILFFSFALWLSLYLRAFDVPDRDLFLAHLQPFLFLFAAWVGVFFIAGLYESRSIILARRALSMTLLVSQTFNIILAALFFFVLPLSIFGIAPKVLLAIYLPVSFALVLVWRVALYPWLGFQKPEQAVAIRSRPEVAELVLALDKAPRAPTRVAVHLDPASPNVVEDIKVAIAQYQAKFVIADFNDPRVAAAFPDMYNFLSVGIRFFDAMMLYEEVFGRIPLSIIDERWLARNVSRYSKTWYDPLKRLMDIAIALPLGILSLIIYPFIIFAQKVQDGGLVFYKQYRTGLHNRPFLMLKFRSMSGVDQGDEVLKSKYVVTPVGRVIRKTRLDELPQLWNVLKGDISLIGPRPEFPALVEEYTKKIPYYNARHLIKPGASGWAQLYHDNHPHHGAEVDATREKLSYDLYYLKHRSLMLDLVIALKTIKKLITRSGV